MPQFTCMTSGKGNSRGLFFSPSDKSVSSERSVKKKTVRAVLDGKQRLHSQREALCAHTDTFGSSNWRNCWIFKEDDYIWKWADQIYKILCLVAFAASLRNIRSFTNCVAPSVYFSKGALFIFPLAAHNRRCVCHHSTLMAPESFKPTLWLWKVFKRAAIAHDWRHDVCVGGTVDLGFASAGLDGAQVFTVGVPRALKSLHWFLSVSQDSAGKEFF